MKKMSKKVLCLLSGAVLLCGASAITASAAPVTDFRKPVVTQKKNNIEFCLKETDLTIMLGEKVTLEVGTTGYTTSSGRFIEKYTPIPDKVMKMLSFQWYNENGPIAGATSSTYTTGRSGKYFCRVYNKAALGGGIDEFPDKYTPSTVDLGFVYLDTDVATIKLHTPRR